MIWNTTLIISITFSFGKTLSCSLTYTTANQSYGEKYFATLNGSNSFPPIDTNAYGMAEINIEENNSTFSLELMICTMPL